VGQSKANQDNALLDVVVMPSEPAPSTCAPCTIHWWGLYERKYL
jgi:hypothetical protein